MKPYPFFAHMIDVCKEIRIRKITLPILTSNGYFGKDNLYTSAIPLIVERRISFHPVSFIFLPNKWYHSILHFFFIFFVALQLFLQQRLFTFDSLSNDKWICQENHKGIN